MHFSATNRRLPAWQALALFTSLTTCLASASFAQHQEDKTLPTVIVTASRFANDPAFAPIGATVITAEEIRAAGIDNVNQAVRKIGGVYGRQSLNGTQDFDLDLRGFGANSNQNLVVMIDGIRLSENELTVSLLSSIPVDTVERIEIIRGGSSVLYGEGATGGVIHVITRRGKVDGTHGSVTAEVGQFSHREGRASVMKGWDGFSLDANVSKMQTDNYRDNNALKQENFGGGLQWASAQGRFGVRIDAARQDSQLPGALNLAQFKSNPRQTLTPNDHASIDTDRYTAFVERKFGAWEAAAELSHREKKATSFFDDYSAPLFPFASTADSKQSQFSPRIRTIHSTGSLVNEFVAGMDFIHWDLVNVSSFSRAEVAQQSKAIYVRDEVKLGKARFAAGVRHEKFDKDSEGHFDISQSLNAWELQGSYAVTPLMTLFAKAGHSYRIATADENAFTLNIDQPLKPQKSRDLELGGSVGNKAHKVSLKVFQHRLSNEIFFDPTVNFGFGANVNLDSTRRRGFEIEGSTRLAPAWLLTAQWQHVNATFTDGPSDGREMVLVPRNIFTTRLSWLPAQGHSASFGAQWVDDQRYGNDFDNACSSRIPSYTVLDARYARRAGHWEFAVTGENLADRQYFNQAFGCRAGIYPNSGRQLKLSARYDF